MRYQISKDGISEIREISVAEKYSLMNQGYKVTVAEETSETVTTTDTTTDAAAAPYVPSIKLTLSQEKAFYGILTGSSPICLLSGNAGTGKTTLITEIIKAVAGKRHIFVCAPTHKAKNVLVRKGIEKAQTLHSTVYEYDDFTMSYEDTRWDHTSGIIFIDEVSMLDDEILDQTLKLSRQYKYKAVFIGDNFQLPPVEASKRNVFERGFTEFNLREVMRQKGGSEILTLAHAIRNRGECLIPSKGKGEVEISTTPKILADYVSDIKSCTRATMLCFKNKTRVSLNNAVREALGRERFPETGDMMISIANSSDIKPLSDGEDILREVSNAVQFILPEIDKEVGFNKVRIQYRIKSTGGAIITKTVEGLAFKTYEGHKVLMPIDFQSPTLYHGSVENVIGEDGEHFVFMSQDDKTGRWRLPHSVLICTYGYVITAHKSQGSQWERVYVAENRPAFPGDKKPTEPAQWLYTAITRAEKKVILGNLSAAHMSWADLEKAANFAEVKVEPAQKETGKTPVRNRKAEIDAEIAEIDAELRALQERMAKLRLRKMHLLTEKALL